MKRKSDAAKGDTLTINDPENKTPFIVDFKTITNASLTLRALNNPFRKKILQYLSKHKNVPVNTICKSIKIPQTVASHQLAVLRQADVVTSQRQGKLILYSINGSRLQEITSMAERLC